jgi:hypothetical protein
MITVPTLASMLTVIGVALLAVVVLSAIVGALFLRTDEQAGTSRPAGGTPAPQGLAPQRPAPQPAPEVPSRRDRAGAGVH